jgi:UMF1 family MFS transporter
VGVPFTFLWGVLASRFGAKRCIFVTLAVYLLITLTAYYMTTILHFMLLAVLVATVMGGSQALSRSLFATLIPKHRSAEFFAFYGVFEKFAGIIGPAMFAAVIAATGASRNAILALDAFFLVGAALLAFVDVEGGRRIARAAEGAAGLPAA